MTYLTTEQAGGRLGKSVSTMQRMRADGTGPRFERKGKFVVYPEDAVVAFAAAAASMVRPTSKAA